MITASVKSYRVHYCNAKHRTYRTMAKCVWRRAAWIMGDGEYASVAWCHRGATVQLHATAGEAEQAKAIIDASACGGRCTRRHEVIRLVLDGC